MRFCTLINTKNAKSEVAPVQSTTAYRGVDI